MSGGEYGPAREDLLDTGTPNRLGPWLAVAVVAALGLLGWRLQAPEPPAEVLRPIEVVAPEPVPATPTETITLWGQDMVTDVTFVDDLSGFAIEQQCSTAAADAFGCGRRLLTTTDGGATWTAVRTLPSLANGYGKFVALSADVMMLLDIGALSGVVRSTDGGRSWVRFPLTRAGPRPLAPSGVPVLDGPVICNRQCEPTTISWFDPVSLALHPLPTQPVAAELARTEFTHATTIDGDIVVGGTTLTGAYVAISRNSGRTWSQTRLDPDLTAGQAVMSADVRAAGGGRAYAFIQVDGVGDPTTFGYRTDDGGVRWVGLPLEPQPWLWAPLAVVDGELLALDMPGRVHLSAGGGTSWTEVDTAPQGIWIRQGAPGNVLLGTVSAGAVQVTYLSRDGVSWWRTAFPSG